MSVHTARQCPYIRRVNVRTYGASMSVHTVRCSGHRNGAESAIVDQDQPGFLCDRKVPKNLKIFLYSFMVMRSGCSCDT